jgi:hypothetical protein
LRVNDDKVLEETHALFADLLESAPYIRREGMVALTKILAETHPKVVSFKMESIIEDRFVRELENSGFVNKLYR